MLIVFLSYWKLVFTRQFTLLAEWEIVNQAYAWYTYAAKSIQSGILPLWPVSLRGQYFHRRDADGALLSAEPAPLLLPAGFQRIIV